MHAGASAASGIMQQLSTCAAVCSLAQCAAHHQHCQTQRVSAAQASTQGAAQKWPACGSVPAAQHPSCLRRGDKSRWGCGSITSRQRGSLHMQHSCRHSLHEPPGQGWCAQPYADMQQCIPPMLLVLHRFQTGDSSRARTNMNMLAVHTDLVLVLGLAQVLDCRPFICAQVPAVHFYRR